MRKALRKGQFAGVILYKGPSMLNTETVVAIANRIAASSGNEKTGAMVQTFIIRADMSPLAAIDQAKDYAICGNCPQRRSLGGACYVNVAQSVQSVYRAYERGRYAMPGLDYDPAILPDLFAGLDFRLGTYGDPTAIPLFVWQACVLKARSHTGYTHQWRDPRFAGFKALCMASCDNAQDYLDAKAKGWRTFRSRLAGEAKQAKEVICPASKEAGVKTNCAACHACGGLSSKAKADIVIVAHGALKSRFAKVHTNGQLVAAE